MEQFLYENDLLYSTGKELNPVNGRKSFYNKCKLYKNEDNVYFLISYDTVVCSYNPNTKEFVRLWRDSIDKNCWSRTTNNHIDGFRAYFGLGRISKKEWLEL